jgi:hypothetical protein
MNNEDTNPFINFLRSYRNNPVNFVKIVLKATPDPWQAEFLQAVARGERRISIRSGHGTGKSTAASWAMLWFLITRYPCKIVVTAPTSAQLFDALFAECKRWMTELPPVIADLLEAKADRIMLKASPTEAFISCRTSRAETPEALQGVHSENVLLVADEASGIPESVFESAAGSMSGEHASTILLGNPTRSSGFFFDTHHRMADTWWTRKVSCIDSPRVSEEYVGEMKIRYGEDSNAYRVRVLGEFPLADDDTAIPLELVEAAQHRAIEIDKDVNVVWGLDVARFGSAASALAKRQGKVIKAVQIWRGLDLMQLTGAVKAEYDALEERDRPAEILIDSIGVGGGVVDRLVELGLPAIGINTAESPSMKGTYFNLRAELWFKVKAFLEARDSKLPKDDKLLAELVSPRYKFTSSGKMQIESKDQMRKRGLPSPDRADAVCLCFAGQAATALHGANTRTSWKTPIKRNISGIV